ncbi:MAG: cation-efflux pump, partial [Angelakisella sp.]
VLHMDPIVTDDEEMSAMRQQMVEILQGIDSGLSMHDFRAVMGETHNNLIFDVVVPYGMKLSNIAIKDAIDAAMADSLAGCYSVVTFDRAYTLGNSEPERR